MRIVAGVDCHKRSHTIVFLDGLGQVVQHLTIPTTADGYEQALMVGDSLGCVEWGVEGAGCYGFAFAVYASAHEAVVVEVPGAFTKRHRRHASQRGKSDAQDARAIAEVVLREPDRLPKFFLAATQRALRLRYDQRDRLVRERTRAVNRLRMGAILLGVTELPTDLTTAKAARRIITQARGLREAVQLGPAGAAIVDEIEEAAEDVLRLNERIKGAEKAIRPLVRKIAAELLQLHGVSDVVAAGLIGHAGDMRNYRNAAAFAAKCGAAPVPCSSGRNTAMRVNTGGDRQLNRLLHTIALTQVRTEDHEGRRYYDRKRAEGKTHLAALRCLKRVLAGVVYYRLRASDQVLNRVDAQDGHERDRTLAVAA
ncbi:MAG: IS110 family transposase [Gemmatimonadota bacterium]